MKQHETAGTASGSQHHSDTADEVAALNRRWMSAYVERDASFLERYMADDYVGTFPDGTVHDKASELAAVASGAIAIEDMRPLEMVVRAYGDAVVLTGRSRIRATLDGRSISDEFRFTDVWIRSEGRWQAVASQVTRIEAAPIDRA